MKKKIITSSIISLLFSLGLFFINNKDQSLKKIISLGHNVGSYLNDSCVEVDSSTIDGGQFYLLHNWESLPSNYKKSGKYFPFRQIELSSTDREILKKYNLFKLTKQENHYLLTNKYFTSLAFSIEEDEIKKYKNKKCTDLKTVALGLNYSIDQCISFYNLVDNQRDYYKIVDIGKEDLMVEGIYQSNYKDKIVKAVANEPLFNFYFPHRKYPFEISYKSLGELVKPSKCPSEYQTKFEIGQCIKELSAKIIKIDNDKGVYELKMLKRQQKRAPASSSFDGFGKKMTDFYKFRRKQGFLEFYFYDQDKYTTVDCSTF